MPRSARDRVERDDHAVGFGVINALRPFDQRAGVGHYARRGRDQVMIGDSGEHSRLLQRLGPFVARNQNEFSGEVIARGRAQNRAALSQATVTGRRSGADADRGSKKGKSAREVKRSAEWGVRNEEWKGISSSHSTLSPFSVSLLPSGFFSLIHFDDSLSEISSWASPCAATRMTDCAGFQSLKIFTVAQSSSVGAAQVLVNFAAGVRGALARGGVAGQNRAERVRRAAADFLKYLEHLDHSAGVITGVFKIVEPQVIGLAFGVAAVFHQKTAADQIAHSAAEVRARLPAENGAGDRRKPGERAVLSAIF